MAADTAIVLAKTNGLVVHSPDHGVGNGHHVPDGNEAPIGDSPSESDAQETADADPEFWPFFAAAHGYEVRDGAVYLAGALVCKFVPKPIGEVVRHHDLDDETRQSRSLVMQFEMPDGQVFERRLEPCERELDRGKAIVRALPSDIARLSVTNTKHVALAAAALKAPDFFVEHVVEQSGWLPGSDQFALPGAPGVDLRRIASVPGARLLRFPSNPDEAATRQAVTELVAILESAPAEVTVPVIGAMVAAPIFDQKLRARGFITKVSGATGSGKTTLVRTAYCLVGDFFLQPGCMATWRSTTTTIEQLVHVMRHLPAFIDDYRTTDRGATETLRDVAMMVGNGVGRVRSIRRDGALGMEPALRANALVVATGEHIAEHDGGVAARILEIDARDIDFARLVSLQPDALKKLPHLYVGYIRWLALMPEETWVEAREQHRALCDTLDRTSRAVENVATLLVSLQLLLKFLEYGLRVASPQLQRYQAAMTSFENSVPELLRVQQLRIREATVEQMALSELARGIRAGEVIVRRPPGDRASPQSAPLTIGYDEEYVYLPPTETERWVSNQLRRAGVVDKPLGRRNLGAALAKREEPRQMTLDGRRTHFWVMERSRLGDEWRDLLP